MSPDLTEKTLDLGKKNTGTETLGVFLAIYRYDPLVGNLQTHLGLVQLDQNPSMD